MSCSWLLSFKRLLLLLFFSLKKRETVSISVTVSQCLPSNLLTYRKAKTSGGTASTKFGKKKNPFVRCLTPRGWCKVLLKRAWVLNQASADQETRSPLHQSCKTRAIWLSRSQEHGTGPMTILCSFSDFAIYNPFEFNRKARIKYGTTIITRSIFIILFHDISAVWYTYRRFRAQTHILIITKDK